MNAVLGTRCRWSPLAAMALLLIASLAQAAPSGRASPGQALFQGQSAVSGHISGHQQELPVQASRCINCHAGPDAAPTKTAKKAIAPQLNASWLTQARSRRGGPPSKYDEAAFCKLLVQGVDPAYITLPGAMPRYRVSTDQCHALWNYLTQDRP